MKHNNNPVFPEGFLWGASSCFLSLGEKHEDKDIPG